ncbi:UbiX family flavin prenyltransferase [Campylobacter sp. MIT 97-5078]|uniref:UbiX family flavin prenyltransferase n=1 Tax=Campylobacter sp. MIT 97-5078 TaxID=1548153 RepID=UPI000512E382|nr:UbiX family flavin prenyltransferase [Campylobacter sp. MIT 97-5078]KGI57041.1 3-octaprenyl-4-hydroxybenzoate carboxy-lyase [Campylobacter sp. MIT 97-5078]TQR28130.1 UbiX family flavin prenyltransferase [Campylobacter sp. MIT 97-5078]
MKILVGISGASSVNLGFSLLKALEDISLQEQSMQIYAVMSEGAKMSFLAENAQQNILHQDEFLNFCKDKFKLVKTHFFDDRNLAAGVSSGSFGIEKTIIAPCSINTLAQIYQGLAHTLLTRACAVALKEQKKLILGVRELPFSSLNLKHMYKLSKMGVCIAPPVIASYSNASSLKELENFIVGKWLDLLGLEHDLFKKWQNELD